MITRLSGRGKLHSTKGIGRQRRLTNRTVPLLPPIVTDIAQTLFKLLHMTPSGYGGDGSAPLCNIQLHSTPRKHSATFSAPLNGRVLAKSAIGVDASEVKLPLTGRDLVQTVVVQITVSRETTSFDSLIACFVIRQQAETLVWPVCGRYVCVTGVSLFMQN